MLGDALTLTLAAGWVAAVGAFVAATSPLLVEVLRTRSSRPDPHPSARQSLTFKPEGGGPIRRRLWVDSGMPDDMSLVVDFMSPPDAQMQCWFWLIKAGDASHYKVILDGHCLWSELPLVLSGLQSVMELGTRSLDDAPAADAR